MTKRGRPTGYKLPDLSKLKISISKTGQSHSAATKEKIAASVRRYYEENLNPEIVVPQKLDFLSRFVVENAMRTLKYPSQRRRGVINAISYLANHIELLSIEDIQFVFSEVLEAFYDSYNKPRAQWVGTENDLNDALTSLKAGLNITN